MFQRLGTRVPRHETECFTAWNTLFPAAEHFVPCRGTFGKLWERNRLYSVLFDFTVEGGQSDFEQTGGFGLITFRIFQYTGDVTTLHSRKFKTVGTGFIGLFVMCVLYIERQAGRINLRGNVLRQSLPADCGWLRQ